MFSRSGQKFLSAHTQWRKVAVAAAYHRDRDLPVEEADAMQSEGAGGGIQQHLHQPSIAVGKIPDVPVNVLQ